MNEATRKEWMVDNETGELLFETEEDVKLYLFTERGFLLFNRMIQVRMYPFVSWNITDHDRIKLHKLAAHLSRNNELTQPGRHDRPMTIEQIAEVTGLSMSRTYAFLRRMKDADIIKQDEGTHVMNPLYYNAAGRITERLYRLFQGTLDPYMSDWIKRKVKELW